MRRTIYHFSIALATLLFVACSPDEELEGEQPSCSGLPIRVHTRAVADGNPDSGLSGRLLFWGSDAFHDKWMMGDVSASPMFTVLLDKPINNYAFDRHAYYETPYTYPDEHTKVYATGYAPDNELTPVDGRGYTELAVNTQDGTADLLSCDGSEAHSASLKNADGSDNTFLLKEKELRFRHLTAKLTFQGERSADMVGLVGVRYIRIRLNEPNAEADRLYVPVTLKLHARKNNESTKDYSTYIISQTGTYPYSNEMVYRPIIPPDETVDLGSLYVVSRDITYEGPDDHFDPVNGEWVGTALSGTPRLGITITADLYYVLPDGGVGPSSTETWKLDPVTDWESSTGDKFLPGYEYKVTIRFTRSGVLLRAKALPWNSEELHEYPIHPADVSSNRTSMNTKGGENAKASK